MFALEKLGTACIARNIFSTSKTTYALGKACYTRVWTTNKSGQPTSLERGFASPQLESLGFDPKKWEKNLSKDMFNQF